MKKEYVLINGTKYIKQNFVGQYKQVNDLALADTFKTQQSAKNFMVDSLVDVFSGYKAYEKLHNLLVKRPHLKNEHRIIGAINYNQIATQNISNILGVIKESKNQTYSQRKTPELFELGIDFDKREVCDGSC